MEVIIWQWTVLTPPSLVSTPEKGENVGDPRIARSLGFLGPRVDLDLSENSKAPSQEIFVSVFLIAFLFFVAAYLLA